MFVILGTERRHLMPPLVLLAAKVLLNYGIHNMNYGIQCPLHRFFNTYILYFGIIHLYINKFLFIEIRNVNFGRGLKFKEGARAARH